MASRIEAPPHLETAKSRRVAKPAARNGGDDEPDRGRILTAPVALHRGVGYGHISI
jgi:hypothetical protein